MKIEILGNAETIISNPDSKHGYFGWPSVAKLPDGRLAAVCSGYRCSHVCPFGKTVMATSDDSGRTWTGAYPVIDTPLDDRDGGIAVFGENGVIVTSFNNTVKAQRNWNPVYADLDGRLFKRNSYYNAYLNTVTKSDEEKYLGATFRLSFDSGRTFGELYKSPVTSPHGPARLNDGTLLWVGRTFSADDSFDEETSRVEAYKISTDGAMERLGTVPPVYRNGIFVDLCEPYAVQLPDGEIICHIRTEGEIPFSLLETRSKDGGRTWSEPVQLLGDRGGAPAHLLLHSSGVLISAYGYREKPFGVRVMLSADRGKTWEKDIPLYTGISSDLGYPCTVELDDGSLLTVFYAKDEEDGPAVIKKQLWRIVR